MEEFFFGTGPIRWIQELFGLGRPLAFRIFSLVGDTWGMLLAVGAALWLFGRRTFHAVVGMVFAGAATKLLLSRVFHQERPRGAEIVVYERLEVSSFPSGHVYAAVGPWGLLWALGCVPLWVPALMAVLVSLGRLYLGTHFVGDVVAGVGFGAVLVWAYHRALPHVGRWLAARPRSFWIGAAALGFAGTLAWMLLAGGNARRYEIYGILVAASVALPLQSRLLPDDPAPAFRGSVLPRLLLGTAGIAAFLLWDRSRSDQALLLGTLTAGLATLWTVLGAPALFRTLARGGSGWTGRRSRGG